MPAHRFPSRLGLIEAGRVDFTPLVTRRVTLSQAICEFAAFNAPAPAPAGAGGDYRFRRLTSAHDGRQPAASSPRQGQSELLFSIAKSEARRT